MFGCADRSGARLPDPHSLRRRPIGDRHHTAAPALPCDSPAGSRIIRWVSIAEQRHRAVSSSKRYVLAVRNLTSAAIS
jgi:hypothetical protein